MFCDFGNKSVLCLGSRLWEYLHAHELHGHHSHFMASASFHFFIFFYRIMNYQHVICRTVSYMTNVFRLQWRIQDFPDKVWGGRQFQRWERQPTTLTIFSQKLHEIEKQTEPRRGHTSLVVSANDLFCLAMVWWFYFVNILQFRPSLGDRKPGSVHVTCDTGHYIGKTLLLWHHRLHTLGVKIQKKNICKITSNSVESLLKNPIWLKTVHSTKDCNWLDRVRCLKRFFFLLFFVTLTAFFYLTYNWSVKGE